MEVEENLEAEEVMNPAKKRRIYQIAKELNLSHEEIINFLGKNEIIVQSHMSPVDDDVYMKILGEFAKEKVIVERQKREQVQKDLELIKKKEEELQRQKEEEEKEAAGKAAEKEEVSSEEMPAAEELGEVVFKIVEEAPEAVAVQEEEEPTVIEVKKVEEPPKKKKEEKKKKKAIEVSDADDEQKKKRVRVKKPKRGTIAAERGVSGKARKKRRRRFKIDEKQVDESIKRTLADLDAGKSKRRRKKSVSDEATEEEESNILLIPEYSSVGDLANLMDVEPSEVIEACMSLGFFVTINHRLDSDAQVLVADEFGFEVHKEEEYGADIVSQAEEEESEEDLQPRAPVVTVMGHVDHGKTSLLDYIRSENVVAGESGGITQHIGAYRVELPDGRPITFLDTPGHEAFTAMRARGARVTDIVVLVIAADDGVKPQTIEAINHAKAADVPLVVAINKIDKPSADPEKVKSELIEHNVVVESFGGKVQSALVSAKSGEGVSELLDLILLETEMLEIKANTNALARGVVIEAKLDKGLGPLGTILIQRGTLKVGDSFVCGANSGKVRALLNERNQRIEEVKPSEPAQVLGFDTVPTASDLFAVLEQERDVKRISQERKRLKREQEFRKVKMLTLDEISRQILEGKVRELSIIIKGDTDGSVEALYDSLNKLGTKEVSVKVIHHGVGNINEGDILLASASGAVVIGFHVTARTLAVELAKKNNVDIRFYTVIYDVVDEIKLALEGLLEPEKIHNVLATIEIRRIFKTSKFGIIAGCYVNSGKVKRGDRARLLRGEDVIGETVIASLKRFQDDIKEVAEGFECGITLEKLQDLQENDMIEVYEISSRKRKLEESVK